MVSFVNSVTESLLTAFTHIKAAEKAVDVYESAKARGDQGVMKRALSYASPEISGAIKQSKEVSGDLQEAREKAKEEEKKTADNEEKKSVPSEKTAIESKDKASVSNDLDDNKEKTDSASKQSDSEVNSISNSADAQTKHIDIIA